MDKNFTIQLLRWIARGFFVLAVLALGTTLLRSRADTDAEKPQHPIVTLEERQPVDIDWATQRFFTWGSDELGIRLECPVGWSPSQVFDRFTKRRVADLTAYDVVAFRSGEPRSAR